MTIACLLITAEANHPIKNTENVTYGMESRYDSSRSATILKVEKV
jgi:hypothetical protein